MAGRTTSGEQKDSTDPAPKGRSRASTTILFTVVQIWASAELIDEIHPNGAARVALAFVLASGAFAIVDAWRRVRRSGQ